MANVLSGQNREQVLALGRLGRSLQRMEEVTGMRRETESRYLCAARIAARTWRTFLTAVSAVAAPTEEPTAVELTILGMEAPPHESGRSRRDRQPGHGGLTAATRSLVEQDREDLAVAVGEEHERAPGQAPRPSSS